MNKEALKSIYAYNMLFNNVSGNDTTDNNVKLNTNLISDFDLQNFNPKRFEYYTTLLKMFDNDQETLEKLLAKYNSVKSLRVKERKLIREINDYVNKINKVKTVGGAVVGGDIDSDIEGLLERLNESTQPQPQTPQQTQSMKILSSHKQFQSIKPQQSFQSIKPQQQASAQQNPDTKFKDALIEFKDARDTFKTTSKTKDDIDKYEESINKYDAVINSYYYHSGGIQVEVFQENLKKKRKGNNNDTTRIPEDILKLARDIIAQAREEVKLERKVLKDATKGEQSDNKKGSLKKIIFLNLKELLEKPIISKIEETSGSTQQFAKEANLLSAKALVLEAYTKEYEAFVKLKALEKGAIFSTAAQKKVSDLKINDYKIAIYDIHKEAKELEDKFNGLLTEQAKTQVAQSETERQKEAQLAEAKEQLAEAKEQLKDAEERLEQSREELTEAELEEAQEQFTERQIKKAEAEAEAELAKAESAKAQQEVEIARQQHRANSGVVNFSNNLRTKTNNFEEKSLKYAEKLANIRKVQTELADADKVVKIANAIKPLQSEVQRKVQEVKRAESEVETKTRDFIIIRTHSSNIQDEEDVPETLKNIRLTREREYTLTKEELGEEEERLQTEDEKKAGIAKNKVSNIVKRLKEIAKKVEDDVKKALLKKNFAGLELVDKVNKEANESIKIARVLVLQAEAEKESAFNYAKKAEKLDDVDSLMSIPRSSGWRNHDRLEVLFGNDSPRFDLPPPLHSPSSRGVRRQARGSSGGASPEEKYSDDTLKAQYLEKQRYRSIPPRTKEEFRDVKNNNKGTVVRIKTDNKIEQLSNDIDTYNTFSVEDREDNKDAILKKIKDFENDPQNPLEELEITLDDRIVFIIATFFIRYITLLMVQWCIDINIITSFYEGFIYYAVIYIILFWFVVLFINIDNSYDVKYMNFNGIINSIRSLFFYFYMGTNGISRLLIHTSLIILLIVIPIILNIKKKPEFKDEANHDDTVATVKLLNYDERKQLSKTLTLFTMFIWLFTSIIATKF